MRDSRLRPGESILVVVDMQERLLPSIHELPRVLCGVESHICVLQTGLDALAPGYKVHLVTDATSSRSTTNAQLDQRRLERAGAVLNSAEMAIHELLVQAGSPEYKALLPHLE